MGFGNYRVGNIVFQENQDSIMSYNVLVTFYALTAIVLIGLSHGQEIV